MAVRVHSHSAPQYGFYTTERDALTRSSEGAGARKNPMELLVTLLLVGDEQLLGLSVRVKAFTKHAPRSAESAPWPAPAPTLWPKTVGPARTSCGKADGRWSPTRQAAGGVRRNTDSHVKLSTRMKGIRRDSLLASSRPWTDICTLSRPPLYTPLGRRHCHPTDRESRLSSRRGGGRAARRDGGVLHQRPGSSSFPDHH